MTNKRETVVFVISEKADEMTDRLLRSFVTDYYGIRDTRVLAKILRQDSEPVKSLLQDDEDLIELLVDKIADTETDLVNQTERNLSAEIDNGNVALSVADDHMPSDYVAGIVAEFIADDMSQIPTFDKSEVNRLTAWLASQDIGTLSVHINNQDYDDLFDRYKEFNPD